MNKIKLQIAIIAIIAVVVSMVTLSVLQKQDAATQEPEIPRTDKLLAALPSDALVYVRINNFDATVSALDDHLMGISPLPVGMTLKMQLAQKSGDPSLESIDTAGDFALIIHSYPENSFMPPFTINMLVPLKAEKSDPDLQTKQINEDYALISIHKQQSAPDQVAEYKNKLAKSSLAKTLDNTEYRSAESAQIWALGNISQVKEQFEKEISDGLDSARAMLASPAIMQSQPGMSPEMLARILELYINAAQAGLNQTDSISFTADVTPQTLSFSETITSAKGSTFAELLALQQGSTPDLDMAKYIPAQAAVACIANMNPNLTLKLNDMILDLFTEALSDKISSDQIKDMKASSEKWTKNSDGNFALSFSAVEEQPNIDMSVLAKVKDPKAAREDYIKNFDMADLIYQVLMPGTKFSFTENTDEHNGLAINSINLKMALPEEMLEQNPMLADRMDFNYKFTIKDDLLITTFGPEPLESIKSIIDTLEAAKAENAKMVSAIEAFQPAPNAAIIGYLDILGLIKFSAASSMSMQDPDNPAAEMMANMYKDVNFNSQSSLSFVGNIANNKISYNAKLPKQHLLEIIAAVKQIQKNSMSIMAPSENAALQAPQQDLWKCPVHEDIVQLKKIKCPDCGMDMVPAAQKL